MCLILLAINQHPDFPMVLAANRDEFYARPSKPMGWWQEKSKILGGLDLESGGSWLGLTRAGDFAALTNYREAGAKQPQRPSRGILVRDFLQQKNADWKDWLSTNAQLFNGFNLVYGKWNQLNWFSNRSERQSRLHAGIYGLCNSLLDTPWPKVERGKRLMQQVLGQPNFSESDLMRIMQDTQQAADNELPDTGIGQEWERLLSPIFISSATYGTRASTVLFINRKENVRMVERNWQKNGGYSDKMIEFNINRRV